MTAAPMTSAPDTTSADAPRWHVVAATARGRSHVVHDLPNEDAVAHQQVVATAASPAVGTVVAVADGHGHERHFRSAAGSALAVAVACQVAGALARELAAIEPLTVPDVMPASLSHAMRDKLPSAILSDWRAEVARHIKGNPYTQEELSVLDREGDGPEVPYGSTLLVAVVTAGWLICAQIGDGDLVAVHPDGGYSCPVPGDDRLDGLRTTSLCQPNALGAFRVGAYDLAAQPLAVLLLATDGYGNAQAADPWQPQWARDMAGLAAERDAEWFARQLPGWAELCASGEGSGDDTTIALLLAPVGARGGEAGTWTG